MYVKVLNNIVEGMLIYEIRLSDYFAAGDIMRSSLSVAAAVGFTIEDEHSVNVSNGVKSIEQNA